MERFKHIHFQKDKTKLFREELEKYAVNIADYDEWNNIEKLYNKYYRPINAAWSSEYNNIRNISNLNNSSIAKYCMVSRNTAKGWESKCPSTREHYIALCSVFGLGVKTCSHMLQRFGQYKGLNENDLEDIVYIRILQISERNLENINNIHLQDYTDLYPIYFSVKFDLDSNNKNGAFAKLRSINDCDFIDLYLNAKKNMSNAAINLDNKLNDTLCNMGFNFKDSFYNEFNLSSIYPKTMSNLTREKNKVIPRRNLLISFLLHMGMPLNEIDEILNIAKMEPLCPKNPYEGSIIFILKKLYNDYPDYNDKNKMISSQNLPLQRSLPDGSVYDYLYNKMNSGDIKLFLEDCGVEIDKEICKNLTTK